LRKEGGEKDENRKHAERTSLRISRRLLSDDPVNSRDQRVEFAGLISRINTLPRIVLDFEVLTGSACSRGAPKGEGHAGSLRCFALAARVLLRNRTDQAIEVFFEALKALLAGCDEVANPTFAPGGY
jgi:hypothetical protein